MVVKLYQVKVSTPDSLLEFQIKHGSSGRQLFNQVCTTMGLREVWYFGLQYTDAKNETKWVKLNKKISPSKSKDTALEFAFKIKFHPEEVTEELIQDATQQLFYYEIKSKVISGEIYCSADHALLLASLQAVVRHGSYAALENKDDYLKVPNYLPKHILTQYNITDEEWALKITHWHGQHRDLSRSDAMLEYLRVVQDLEMYGIIYFPIKNNRNTPLWLGVDALGLNIYDEDNRLTAKVTFPWNEIRKLQYNHAKFVVKPTDTSAKDLIFTCAGTNKCKEVLALCTGNHELYARRRFPDTIEVQQMKAQSKAAKDVREAERERLVAERRARELMEERCTNLERVMKEQEMVYERTQSTIMDYQTEKKRLEDELKTERSAREALEDMHRRLEEMNNRLEMESAASNEERQRLHADRDQVLEQIERQQRLLEAKEVQKKQLESELTIQNGAGEQDLAVLDGLHRPEDSRQAIVETDMDHAKRLEMMRGELSEARNAQKRQKVDIQYDENIAKGMDKYRTLHAIRQGNTKKRVEAFESM